MTNKNQFPKPLSKKLTNFLEKVTSSIEGDDNGNVYTGLNYISKIDMFELYNIYRGHVCVNDRNEYGNRYFLERIKFEKPLRELIKNKNTSLELEAINIDYNISYANGERDIFEWRINKGILNCSLNTSIWTNNIKGNIDKKISRFNMIKISELDFIPSCDEKLFYQGDEIREELLFDYIDRFNRGIFKSSY